MRMLLRVRQGFVMHTSGRFSNLMCIYIIIAWAGRR
jgi:hypothetical protein